MNRSVDLPKLFCLRGYMKSGTNWIGRLLNSHDDISCVGEFHWEKVVAEFERLLESEPIFRQSAKVPVDPKPRVRESFERMLAEVVYQFASPDAIWVGERTPHTIEPLAFKNENAPQICMIRDGRDVLVSRVFHLYNMPHVTGLFERFPSMAKKLVEFQADPNFFTNHPELLLTELGMVEDSIRNWQTHVQQDLTTAQKLPDLKLLFVKYEDVHADTHGQRQRMFDFLGVDTDRSQPLEGELVAGFDNEAPNQFLRKGAVGDWQNYFTSENKESFKSIAGGLLVDLEYTVSLDW